MTTRYITGLLVCPKIDGSGFEVYARDLVSKLGEAESLAELEAPIRQWSAEAIERWREQVLALQGEDYFDVYEGKSDRKSTAPDRKSTAPMPTLRRVPQVIDLDDLEI